MATRSYELRDVSGLHSSPGLVSDHVCAQVIKVFVSTADLKFGPITMIRRPGRPTKKIPWTAFQLSDDDWEKVRLCGEILEVCRALTDIRLSPANCSCRMLTESSNYARARASRHFIR